MTKKFRESQIEFYISYLMFLKNKDVFSYGTEYNKRLRKLYSRAKRELIRPIDEEKELLEKKLKFARNAIRRFYHVLKYKEVSNNALMRVKRHVDLTLTKIDNMKLSRPIKEGEG